MKKLLYLLSLLPTVSFGALIGSSGGSGVPALTANRCVQTDSNGQLSVAGGACGGSGASTLEVNFGNAHSSPTATIQALAPFTGSVSGSTITLKVDSSSFTLLGPTPPASSIAAGSLGSSVIASSLAVNSVTASAVTAGTYSNITGVGTLGGLNVTNGVTASSFTSSGAGPGTYQSTEGAAATGVAGADVLWGDSTVHRFKMINNNGTAAQVVASGVDVNTSDQVTAVHIPCVSVSANYTAVSTNTCIAVTASTVTNTSPIVTLPSATGTGIIVMVYKADQSTEAVTIKGAGTNVIQGTGTLKLNAYTQADQMMDAATGLWIPWGQGIQVTPPYLLEPIGGAGAATATSSDVVTGPFYNPTPIMVKGIRWGASSSSTVCNIDWGIYDLNLNKLVSMGSTNVTVIGIADYNLATPYFLPPGWYYRATQVSTTVSCKPTMTSGVSTTSPFSGQVFAQTTMGLPATLSSGSVATVSPTYMLQPYGGPEY